MSITPWGLTGPWSEQASHGVHSCRLLPEPAPIGVYPSVGPVAAGGQIGEWAAGAYAAVSALVAWLSERVSSGRMVSMWISRCSSPRSRRSPSTTICRASG